MVDAAMREAWRDAYFRFAKDPELKKGDDGAEEFVRRNQDWLSHHLDLIERTPELDLP